MSKKKPKNGSKTELSLKRKMEVSAIVTLPAWPWSVPDVSLQRVYMLFLGSVLPVCDLKGDLKSALD